MKVGQLAKAAGISVQTIRFYERRGLLPAPLRLTSGYRDYPADTVSAVLFIIFVAGSSLIRQSNKVEGATMNGQADNNATEQKKSAHNPVFACNMLALNAEGRKGHVEVTKRLRAATKEERELPDGYGFRFSSDQPTILLVSEFIARERLCCPFLTFEMVVESEDGPLWMRLRGAEGVKNFIRVEFGMK
jgi:MerR-like DNA binding protein